MLTEIKKKVDLPPHEVLAVSGTATATPGRKDGRNDNDDKHHCSNEHKGAEVEKEAYENEDQDDYEDVPVPLHLSLSRMCPLSSLLEQCVNNDLGPQLSGGSNSESCVEQTEQLE